MAHCLWYKRGFTQLVKYIYALFVIQIQFYIVSKIYWYRTVYNNDKTVLFYSTKY